jgi:hypothetical protein
VGEGKMWRRQPVALGLERMHAQKHGACPLRAPLQPPARHMPQCAHPPAEARGETRKAATAPTSVAASSFLTGAFSYE